MEGRQNHDCISTRGNQSNELTRLKTNKIRDFAVQLFHTICDASVWLPLRPSPWTGLDNSGFLHDYSKSKYPPWRWQRLSTVTKAQQHGTRIPKAMEERTPEPRKARYTDALRRTLLLDAFEWQALRTRRMLMPKQSSHKCRPKRRVPHVLRNQSTTLLSTPSNIT